MRAVQGTIAPIWGAPFLESPKGMFVASEPTYYEILAVSMHSSIEEVRKAYHKRANECHPDRVRNLDPEIQALAERKMTIINEAYNVLTDQARRQEYDQWLLANADIKVDPTGMVIRADVAAAAEAAAQPGMSTEDLIAKLEAAINAVKNQILTLDKTIRWKESAQEGFDVSLEGMRKIERFFIYISTVDTLNLADVQNLAANAPDIVSSKHFLLHKKFSLFLVLYLEDDDDDQIRSIVRNFNQAAIQSGTGRRSDITMLAIGNIATKEVFFPYVKGFQPKLDRVTLP